MRYYFLFFCLLLLACNPSKKLTKQADALREQKKNEEAATIYYNALLANRNNEKAKEGLRQSAQPVLDDKFEAFRKRVVENNIDEAIRQYRFAQQYAQNAESVGVKLKWQHEYDEVYEDVRQEYLKSLFSTAITLMNQRKYDAAEKIFDQMSQYDSAYAGVSVLRLNTVMEPLYQQGLLELQKEDFKEAYFTFSKLVEIDDTYKDVKQRKQEALKRATAALVVLPVNDNQSKGCLDPLPASITEKLVVQTNAYVNVKDAKAFQVEMNNRGWGNVSALDKAVEMGKNLGIQYFVMVEVINYTADKIPFTKKDQVAYEAFTENILNPYTNTYQYISKFKKVTFADSYESMQLALYVRYQLIDVNAAKVLLTEQADLKASDEQHLFKYNGNIQNLYPELPQGNVMPPLPPGWRDQFTNTARVLKTEAQLCAQMAEELSSKIAGAVLQKIK